ncbi:hypothetical protein PGT21_035769 [Puccinia graminis f. sp. tritici]|uniref:Uncharacterized protein n=1 Tax=Puccinia graminis f. sp. tritici TaxID=56615 RepID=A0A5B0PN25_PUCGR|nr:hypothetical protein PGT21_035769 [Puccinia graminis f. sp. tritici]
MRALSIIAHPALVVALVMGPFLLSAAPGQGQWEKTCDQCFLANPRVIRGQSGRTLFPTDEYDYKTCGELRTNSDCSHEFQVRIYHCKTCNTYAWIATNALCRQKHPNQFPPPCYFKRGENGEISIIKKS